MESFPVLRLGQSAGRKPSSIAGLYLGVSVKMTLPDLVTNIPESIEQALVTRMPAPS